MDDSDTQLPRSRAAIEQLEHAVSRLEGAVARNRDGELSLAAELRRAREDYARLDDTTRLVEQRLDGVIGRLRLMIED